MSEGEEAEDFYERLKAKEATLQDVKKVRISVGGRVRNPKTYNPLLEAVEKDLKAIEEMIVEDLSKDLEGEPVWENFLSRVKGIGPALAAGLLARFDPRKARHVSGYWRHAGLHVITVCKRCRRYFFEDKVMEAKFREELRERITRVLQRRKRKAKPTEKEIEAKLKTQICDCEDPKPVKMAARRIRGLLVDYNPEVKTFVLGRVGRQIMFTKRKPGFYYEVHQKFRALEEAQHPKLGPLHIHRRALRKTMRVLVYHLWKFQREARGLPTDLPYVFAKMGESHKLLIPWIPDK